MDRRTSPQDSTQQISVMPYKEFDFSLCNNLVIDKWQGCHSLVTGVTSIQGKREQNTETGTCINCCYLDSSPVTFTELYKPNHCWYAIVVKFFLLHIALSNKRPCDAIYWLTSFVIYYKYLAYLTLTVRVCYNCFKIWLNYLQVQCRNSRRLWLKCALNSAPITLTKTCGLCYNSSQLSSFFTSEVYRTPCVKPGYHLVRHSSHSEVPAL